MNSCFFAMFCERTIRTIAIIVLALAFRGVYAQSPEVKLSEKHLSKIEKSTSVERKIKLYRKFYHRDSTRQMRAAIKKWERALDSVQFVPREAVTNLSQKKEAPQLTGLTGTLSEQEAVLNSSEIQKLKDEAADIEGYAKKDYVQQGTDFAQQNANEFAPPAEITNLKQQLSATDDLKSRVNTYKQDFSQYSDSTYLKEQAKKKAEELAMKHISENPGMLQSAQKKIAVLMKKYSVVPNSNDLSTSTKRTSMKGKPFGERLMIATNFQFLTLDPLVIDFSPAVGYRFNTKFTGGIGGTYRQTFSRDSLNVLAPKVWGYKGFLSYDVFSNFYGYAEFSRNARRKDAETGNKIIWNEALILGLGRNIKLYKTIDMTVLVAYNVINQKNDPVYPRPLIVRIGFQTTRFSLSKAGGRP
jgi:hypothetical protein